jgi:DNA-nicking Smr family endonuclease
MMTKSKPPKNPTDDDQLVWEHVRKSVKPLKASKQITPELKRTTPRIQQQRVMPMSFKIKPVGELLYTSPRRLKRPEVDAKIDLHGMRQEEARAVLFRFIENGFLKGYKTLLVITGKGLKTLTAEGKPGALKHNFPLWLKEPQVNQLIHFYAPAHARDGGDGAFYVVLRKRIGSG